MTSAFPLIGAIDEGAGLGTPVGTPSIFPSASSPVDFGGKLGTATQNAIGGAVTKALSSAGNSFLGLLFGGDYRYITGIVGLVLIIAGVFLFRPVRDTVVNVATKGAALAA